MIHIVVAAYGSPENLDDVEEYYTRILGRKPPEPLLKELRERYEAIGGHSPLNEITAAQALALQQSLRASGTEAEVLIGLKYQKPLLTDVLNQLAEKGVDEILLLPLTPLNASVSAESYLNIALRHVQSSGLQMRILFPARWHLNAHFLNFWVSEVKRYAEQLVPDAVLFTAHSIPERYEKEPYPGQVKEIAARVAQLANISEYSIAYQSAGRTGERWIGPALEDVLMDLRNSGFRRVLVAPVGFVSEHLEVLYDIDVEAAGFAAKEGIELRRTGLPNTHPEFIAALHDVIMGMIQENAERPVQR